MIGALIGAGIGVLGSVFGGMKASQAAKAAKESKERQKLENENWYNRRYNEDATQRADAQRLLTITQDAIRERNQAAQGRKAVMGGTDESVAATQEAGSKMMADAVGQVAAQAQSSKDRVEQTYMENKKQLDAQLDNIETQRAMSIAQATQGVSGAAANIAGALDSDVIGKKTKADNSDAGTT